VKKRRTAMARGGIRHRSQEVPGWGCFIVRFLAGRTSREILPQVTRPVADNPGRGAGPSAVPRGPRLNPAAGPSEQE
jgi:hypothetical protein